ncbi:MAG: hypothetical protein LJE65_10870 [Desulfobacteraceae bacterium]|nr:hypothetical protein [Desulfobacteraceae bacterium]
MTLDPDTPIECSHRDTINAFCSCPKTDCPRHGICCQCILAHKRRTDDPLAKRLPHCLRELLE